MGLVDYSDSDSNPGSDNQSEKDQAAKAASIDNGHRLKRKSTHCNAHDKHDVSTNLTKRKRSLPPIPTALHDLYASNVRTSTQDDPALHGGRMRQTPHEEGRWPTHVYLEWNPSPIEVDTLSSLVSETHLGVKTPLHISLSRSLTLLTEQRSAFTEVLKEEVRVTNVKPFDITISGINWAPNFERNRWFLVLQLHQPSNNTLNKLLAASNSAAVRCEQPPLYATVANVQKTRKPSTSHNQRIESTASIEDCTDRFHISVAWTLTEPSAEISQLASSATAGLKDIVVHFDNVKLKIGNAVESLPLAKSLSTAGIAGL